MKICLVNNLYHPNITGGAELSVQYIAETLKIFSVDVVVISLKSTPGIKIVEINGVQVYYLGIKNFYWPFPGGQNKILKPFWHILDIYNPLYRDSIQNILDKETPDLVHTNNLSGFSVAAWDIVNVRNLPMVHTLRDYYLLCPRTIMFKNGHNCKKQCLECRIFSLRKVKASQGHDAVIGISKYILKKHLRHGYFSDVKSQQVIHNPYMPSDIPRKRDSNSFNHLNLGYLGRLHPSKGIEIILESLPNNVDLWVAGKGETSYENYLRTRYQSANIHFMGFVKPDDLFSQIDMLVVPSLWNEPMGRTVVESYSFGIPVIASDRGGLPELIEDNQTGFIFNPDDPHSLKNIIKCVISQPGVIPEMRRNCLEKMSEYDPNLVAQRHLRIYQELLNRSI